MTKNSNSFRKKQFSVDRCSLLFPQKMAILRNYQRFAACNKEHSEEHPRSKLVQHSNVTRSQEDYITLVSEEIEGGLTKKLYQDYSRTESCILGALSRLDDFLLNPLIQNHPGTVIETSRNTLRTSQGTNEDDSQSDPHPDEGFSQLSDYEKLAHMTLTTVSSFPKASHRSWQLLEWRILEGRMKIFVRIVVSVEIVKTRGCITTLFELKRSEILL